MNLPSIWSLALRGVALASSFSVHLAWQHASVLLADVPQPAGARQITELGNHQPHERWPQEKVMDSAPWKDKLWLYTQTGGWDTVAAPLKAIWESWWTASWTWVYPGSQEGLPYPDMHQAWHCQLCQRSDYRSLHCIGVAPPWVMWAVLCATEQKGHKTTKEHPKEVCKDGEWSEGMIEVPWFVQHRGD